MEIDSTPRGLRSHSAFKEDTPIVCFNDDELDSYKFDFPHNKMKLTPDTMRQICTVEIYDTLHKRISEMVNPPEWFITTSQKDTFDRLIKEKDFTGAWMCLNSKGWLFKDARKALENLAGAVGDPILNLVTEAWVKIPHEGYEDHY
ncbi:MAG: hypothetical protein JNM27_23195 [Leptospirales bacterium]|nr:hypothetical protein [Leptospirales bacterium]